MTDELQEDDNEGWHHTHVFPESADELLKAFEEPQVEETEDEEPDSV